MSTITRHFSKVLGPSIVIAASNQAKNGEAPNGNNLEEGKGGIPHETRSSEKEQEEADGGLHHNGHQFNEALRDL